jgi:hypothetical protein
MLLHCHLRVSHLLAIPYSPYGKNTLKSEKRMDACGTAAIVAYFPGWPHSPFESHEKETRRDAHTGEKPELQRLAAAISIFIQIGTRLSLRS